MIFLLIACTTHLKGDYDLSGFSCRPAAPVVIEGDLEVASTEFSDLKTLSCLEGVSGTLLIRSNLKLESLDGLENLQNVGALWINDAPLLTSIQGLAGLTSADSVEIDGAPRLDSLVGLQELTEVDGIRLTDLDALPDLTGLNKLETVHTQLSLLNTGVRSLHGLENISDLGGLALGMDGSDTGSPGNPQLADISALARVTAIPGGLSIVNDPALLDFHGLEGLTFVGGLVVEGPYNTEGLEGLTEVAGGVTLREITSLQGLSSLERVGGDIYLGDTHLSSFSDLRQLKYAGGLHLWSNPELQNLEGPSWERLGTVEIGFCWDGIVIRCGGNEGLTSLSGLPSTVGSLMIYDNARLERLAGLEELTVVIFDLKILGNPALTDLGDGSTLRALGRDLIIHGNGELATANAFQYADAIGSIAGTVSISGNAP